MRLAWEGLFLLFCDVDRLLFMACTCTSVLFVWEGMFCRGWLGRTVGICQAFLSVGKVWYEVMSSMDEGWGGWGHITVACMALSIYWTRWGIYGEGVEEWGVLVGAMGAGWMSEYGMFYRMYELQQNRAEQDRTDMNKRVIVILYVWSWKRGSFGRVILQVDFQVVWA